MTTVTLPTPTAGPATTRRRMAPTRRVALYGGVLYLITFAASLPTLKLYANVLDHPGYITSTGSNAPLLWGAWLDIVTGLAGIGTAVALYPVTKRISKSAAIGFVSSRTVEAAVIMAGVLSLMAVVTLRHDLAGATGAQATSLVVTGRALVAVHKWSFLLGPGVMAGVNALFLATMMYKSRLVPRIIPMLGLIGAPLILASDTGTLFGAFGQTSPTATVLAAPIFFWELSLGVWLTFKGFKPSPLTSDSTSS